ncbi:MAG: ASKHA domain-containing protein [Bacteroidales bacterium]|nr:ASKHA domain-containing protein [Bacteroidales bacterium]
MNQVGTLTVILEKDKKLDFPISVGVSVLSVLLDSGVVDVPSPCGGNGLCGKCLVQVIGEDPCPIHPDEERLLTPSQIKQHLRLSCRLMLPYVTDITISLIDNKKQAKVVSTFQERTSLTNRRDEFFTPSFGFAIDIGTTTVVVYLARLDTGEIIDHRSSLNPQTSYGGDVITRIEYTHDYPHGLILLQKVIVEKLALLMKELTTSHQVQEELVMEIVAVGNPTMIHLLVGKDPSGIAIAPFIPTFSEPLEIKAQDNGFHDYPHAKLILPGGVSAYMGSDITVGVRSSAIISSTQPVLYIDIGTNGEIVLFDGKLLHCCSSAAGPAFEGASIQQGMGAVDGAIDRVWLDEEGNVAHSTIGGVPAIGICGSAIIDIMALLLDIGLVDETGAMDDEHPLANNYIIYNSNNVLAFRITDRVSFTHRDVREVQLAKAAIAAGSEVLLKEALLDESRLGSVIIAGGFGSFINIERARRIGLFPYVELDKILTVGNAAGRGALDVLLIEGEAQKTEEIRTSAHYIELSTSQLFNEYYVEQMMFGE